MTYEYRVFIEGPEEISVSHFSSKKLWEGATFRASKPGHGVDGKVRREGIERITTKMAAELGASPDRWAS
jgi:hypothetical protein